VLPFENLSPDPDNAYFANGIQDEILTRLAKIADLKVISRTSTQHYQSKPRNLREIAKQLGVANILEGSVQKAADQVRVNVQLVNAQTDSHLWADSYDRKLTDIFAVESEVAKAVADQLQAKLTGQEKQAIAAKPTDNPEAYDAYLRGRALFAGGSQFDKSAVEGVIHLFREAVKLDPSFALAWAYLSCSQSGSYWLWDASPAQLAAAKDAADRALALDPNLPETHLALGYYRYYGQRDYTAALAEFRQAERGLPNSVDVIEAISRIQRRLGHWDEVIVALRRAIELDPRDINAYNTLAATYSALRRFPEALATVDRALAFDPANTDALGVKATVFWATGDLQAVEPLLANPGTEPLVPGMGWPVRGVQALFQRRYATAIEILSGAVAAKTKRGEPNNDDEKLLLGLSQQYGGDVAAARATYQSAAQDLQRDLEKIVPGSYQAAQTHAALGLAYAGLGEAASAIAEGQKAITMRPTSQDLFEGPEIEEYMARIYALLGDADHAIPLLKRLLQTPYGSPVSLTPALLRLDPMFDPLRNDPRFQKLIATGIAVLPFENRSEDKANAYLADGITIIPVRGVQALFQRRYAAAIEIFSSAVAAKTKRGEPSDYEKLFLGLSQQHTGDVASARATYQRAAQDIRGELAKVAPDSYAAAATHAALGWAYAGLGEAASAIAEGQNAMTIHPTSKDPFGGPEEENRMARIYALLGDADHAIPLLKRLLQIPYGSAMFLTPSLLRIDPIWDQIRNDPRFQKLVASPTPK
jgi:Predicted integral membrane protein